MPRSSFLRLVCFRGGELLERFYANATRSMLSTRFTGGYRTKRCHNSSIRSNRSKNSRSCSMRAGRPFSSSFYTSPRMNRNDGLLVHHEVGAAMTPFLHFFLWLCDVRRSRSSAGSNPLAAAITASFSKITSLVFGAPSGYALCSASQCGGRLISSLTRFSNGRKRNLRPIHSLDQGDWTGRAAVNRFPRQLS